MKGYSLTICLVVLCAPACADDDSLFRDHVLFRDQVAVIFANHCLSCHCDAEASGGLSLSSAQSVKKGGDSGPSIAPFHPNDSLLLDSICGEDPEMPKDAAPLTQQQIAAITKWISNGAKWPKGFIVRPPAVTDSDWWSLTPLSKPSVPNVRASLQRHVVNPIDCFVLAKLDNQGLVPSPSADRRTLIRRLYFDVLGLPPSPEEISRFEIDPNPLAYENLVDELLASPHYGERWARHWLDIVHYGDTHGYDKDKLRPNAWPYRDYVVRSLNADKPYWRFVQEQIAGDALWPHTRDGIEATGFIAAGPWDFIGHAEVPEEKIDGQIARNLDRDDMVTSTMNTFASTTIQCARCHNHKFDPITQEHYYSMQAIFAALDRADREYDTDATIAIQRAELTQRRARLIASLSAIKNSIRVVAGDELETLEQEIAKLKQQSKGTNKPEFGYHSQIEAKPDVIKWVQVDLQESHRLARVTLVGAHDDFAGIGAGFGFPVRFRIETSDDPAFKKSVQLIADETDADYENPGTTPQSFETSARGRFVRVTATKLAERSNDYILALGELIATDADEENLAAGKPVAALDSIEAPTRWQKANLVDGHFRRTTDSNGDVALAEKQALRETLLANATSDESQAAREQQNAQLASVKTQLKKLPAQKRAYVGTVHSGSGSFRGRGHLNGKPRDVFILARGDVRKPGHRVEPGAIPLSDQDNWRFELATEHPEFERRIRLAEWLTDQDNPLTWRSIVNRVWQYHFGIGIVETANDFGRMGAQPTHPELLDWLAATFRDNGQSLKRLHRRILTSATYQQQSTGRDSALEAATAMETDANNRYLWRMNRRALDAESIRDATLAVSERLNRVMYGEAFRDFVLERPEHSPHYEYHKHNPADPKSHRRAVYRFLVRSQQQPFMQTLDCADPSQSVARRDTSITAIQALTLLNNQFMVQMSESFAASLSDLPSPRRQIAEAYERVTGQFPAEPILDSLVTHTNAFGLANTCRVLLNLNEFVFVD